jgi:3-dehydrotetronate 4-kinase
LRGAPANAGGKAVLLGVIADDLTGATDVALMLKREGMRVVQCAGVPNQDRPLPRADAVVVALKSRTARVAEAVEQSLASARALLAAGARQLMFKYCSTFDSTDQGNIGRVAEALMAETGARSAVFCPAFPANKRTVFQGHLFVGDLLLSDSPMRDHPVTPMRDANLVRVLGRQTGMPVDLIAYAIVERGPAAIAAAIAERERQGQVMLVCDAVNDRQLRDLGMALRGAPFLTGGSGIAMGLPANFGFSAEGAAAQTMHAPHGRQLVLAGSCSEATRRQVAAAIEAGLPAFKLDPLAAEPLNAQAEAALRWLAEQRHTAPAVIYATATPDAVDAAKQALGPERAGAQVEQALSRIATGAVEAGTRRLLVAGGETSGAVVAALGVAVLEIGPEIAPGVPWTRSIGTPDLALALKSGNFGADDIFVNAWDKLA